VIVVHRFGLNKIKKKKHLNLLTADRIFDDLSLNITNYHIIGRKSNTGKKKKLFFFFKKKKSHCKVSRS